MRIKPWEAVHTSEGVKSAYLSAFYSVLWVVVPVDGKRVLALFILVDLQNFGNLNEKDPVQI
jgi:hypothetical protein